MTAKYYLKPSKHILWVNIEGKLKKSHWESWQSTAKDGSWEKSLSKLIDDGSIEVQFTTFPMSPPGNSTTIVHNKAHRSDFLRMKVLAKYGGIYLDTDVFCAHSLDELRQHQFTLAFDNVVNSDENAPNARRLNNGVLLSAPNSSFLHVWEKSYNNFDPTSFDWHSSVVPFKLAVQYPDLVHIEMNRISPISYGLQTSEAASALTCGLFLPKYGGIWYPQYDGRKYTFEGISIDKKLYRALNSKLVFHMTMSAVRGISMLRKYLGPDDISVLPSLLGRVWRRALASGNDEYYYDNLYKLYEGGTTDDHVEAIKIWNKCREMLGMNTPIDSNESRRKKKHAHERQQYVEREIP